LAIFYKRQTNGKATSITVLSFLKKCIGQVKNSNNANKKK